MQRRDISCVTKLLNEYLKNVRVHITFNEEEVMHFLLPREDVIHSYVVEDSKTVTDFFSFYSLPSSILKHEQYNTLRVAYSFYNVSTTNRLKQGMEDLLVIARDAGYDVFNALDVMDNEEFID